MVLVQVVKHSDERDAVMVRLFPRGFTQKQAAKNIEDYIKLEGLDKLDDYVIYTLNPEKLR